MWNLTRLQGYIHNIIYKHFDGLVQDCSNSSALAMELLQYCTKPSIYTCVNSMDTPLNKIDIKISIKQAQRDGYRDRPRDTVSWTLSGPGNQIELISVLSMKCLPSN